MRRHALVLALPALAACADLTNQVAGPKVNDVPIRAPASLQQDALVDRYIVVFRDDVQDPFAVADQLVAQFGGVVHFRYAYALKGFAATLPAASLTAIQRSPLVSYVEPDRIATISGSGTDITVSSWGLDRVDQRNLPLSSSYEWTHDGTGVRAYIIDTGILTGHTDFGGRAAIGYDAIGDGRNGQDCHGHGTHVAGTVGGTEYGIARAVSLIAVRVLNCAGSGTYAQVIAGVDWVTANHVPPAVANMSLGGGLSSALNTAVTNAVNAGVTFAVAAGNSGFDACFYSPSSTPAALTVGATTSYDAMDWYSNYGSCLDLFAPGSEITSAWIGSTTATNTISGTSMASPHVAGVAALYLSANPSASPATVESAIESAATPGVVSGAIGPNLLVYSLVNGAGGGTNNPPTALFTHTCNDLSCTFDASGSSDSDGSIATYAWTFGDGGTGSGLTPGHTYTAGGTYTVSLTVTDNGGATGSTSNEVTVSSGGGTTITLNAFGYKVKGRQKADLTWSGATANLDIYRNNVPIVTGTANDGFFTDNIDARGAGSYTYRVCLTGTQTCSNNATVTF
jgi:subtilisin family serine protease